MYSLVDRLGVKNWTSKQPERQNQTPVQTLLGRGHTADRVLSNRCVHGSTHMSPSEGRRLHRQSNSPCTLRATSMAEQTFLKSLPHASLSSFLFRRYVDNRLMLAPSSAFQNPLIQDSCNPSFYKGIRPESVADHQRLGFAIDAQARTATFNMPVKLWQVRSPASAGSWRSEASSFFSRTALIRQYAWPKESVLAQIRALKEISFAPELETKVLDLLHHGSHQQISSATSAAAKAKPNAAPGPLALPPPETVTFVRASHETADKLN